MYRMYCQCIIQHTNSHTLQVQTVWTNEMSSLSLTYGKQMHSHICISVLLPDRTLVKLTVFCSSIFPPCTSPLITSGSLLTSYETQVSKHLHQHCNLKFWKKKKFYFRNAPHDQRRTGVLFLKVLLVLLTLLQVEQMRNLSAHRLTVTAHRKSHDRMQKQALH